MTHSDFSHAHVYFARAKAAVKVTGFSLIRRSHAGSARMGYCLSLVLTFSRDRAAMQECLNGYYPDGRRPERLGSPPPQHASVFLLHGELGPISPQASVNPEAIEGAMTEFFFDPEVVWIARLAVTMLELDGER
ncbi:MAG: hypothetical protein R2911_36325 [Caldilineaceae bacterium]